MSTFWLVVASILMTLNASWLPSFAQATSASMFQFLERPNAEGDQSWSHLLPTNFYSEMNQQYYRRFRRHGSGLEGQRRRHQFEYAQYI
ncbi:uncharacterized protein [Drosophila kikkawai]|uniref:Uncharacterized protein n=1 Tax=Drosophila kikkawai TaxID=30033 RepID=A0A6P4HSW2_DROKI|nr:uncharacterized protein LOC108072482 [Drosophila kikkawai]